MGGKDKRLDFLNAAYSANFNISEDDLREMTSFVKEKFGEIDFDSLAYFGYKFSTNRLGLYVFSDRLKLKFDRPSDNSYINFQYNPTYIHFVFDTNNSNKLLEKNYILGGKLNLNVYQNQESRIVYNVPHYLERHLFTFNDMLKEKGLTKGDKNFFSGLFNGLIQALLFPLNLIKQAVDGVMNAVNSIGTLIVNAVKELGKFLLDGLKSLFIPSEGDFNLIMTDFVGWFNEKLGALGQIVTFVTSFVTSLTSGAKNFVVDLPPISLGGITIINFDYDISQITTTYKTLYDLYYNFVSAGLVFSVIGYLTTQMDTFFND